jgi:hypothetical protein
MATETNHTTDSFSEDVVDSLGDAFDKALETIEGNDAEDALEKEGTDAKAADADSDTLDEDLKEEGGDADTSAESEGDEQGDESVAAPVTGRRSYRTHSPS